MFDTVDLELYKPWLFLHETSGTFDMILEMSSFTISLRRLHNIWSYTEIVVIIVHHLHSLWCTVTALVLRDDGSGLLGVWSVLPLTMTICWLQNFVLLASTLHLFVTLYLDLSNKYHNNQLSKLAELNISWCVGFLQMCLFIFSFSSLNWINYMRI